jgi:hypothetical protein
MKAVGKASVAVGLALVLAMALSSCASKPQGSGFLQEYAANLQPGPEGGAKERWLKPGVDFKTYDKLMVDSVVFYFAEDSESKAIDPEKLKEMSDIFNQEFVQVLKEKVPIVAEPGPGVARIRVAITNLKLNNQAVSAVSTITSLTPIGLGLNLVKRGATGTWAGSGMTAADMMILDTATNEVIAVARDEQAAGFTERYTEMGSVKAAFKVWAERIVKFMDELRAPKS